MLSRSNILPCAFMEGNQAKSYTVSPSRIPSVGTIGNTVLASSVSSYTFEGLFTKMNHQVLPGSRSFDTTYN